MSALVWFKKDLRVHDHEALFRAQQESPILGLYIVEPEWVRSYGFDPSHWHFLKESLTQLHNQLALLGIPLVVRFGSACEVLAQLHKEWPFRSVHSHQETGVDWTYRRDLKVQGWMREKGIRWMEYLQFGVFRPTVNRDVWAAQRKAWLNKPEFLVVSQNNVALKVPPSDSLGHIEQKLQIPKNRKQVQAGGESEALKTLDSFLNQRSPDYLAHISKPLQSARSGSRLSPYLSYGNLSLRHVHRKTQAAKAQVSDFRWRKSLVAFESRLWWHCHFIQKLESEPDIEFENMNREFDQLRESEFNSAHFEAWSRGQTGVPLVDAVMRCLLETGWVNFRMRAMLVSFASYQLWLDWRKTSHFLAKHFLDFEPGIHFSQFQMQSGVTGINAIRIYSPEKQTQDQDPTGEFILRYCPELAGIPEIYLGNPQVTPPLIQMEAGCRIGVDYPEPIVDLEESYQLAKKRIFAWKAKPAVKRQSQRVYQKHGSREGAHFPRQKRS